MQKGWKTILPSPEECNNFIKDTLDYIKAIDVFNSVDGFRFSYCFEQTKTIISTWFVFAGSLIISIYKIEIALPARIIHIIDLFIYARTDENSKSFWIIKIYYPIMTCRIFGLCACGVNVFQCIRSEYKIYARYRNRSTFPGGLCGSAGRCIWLCICGFAQKCVIKALFMCE